MQRLLLHDFHDAQGARFGCENGAEVVMDYGNPAAEYDALLKKAALIDLSFRGRVCVTGADRVRFLHGQVTNDIKRLQIGQGCYAALVNAKGRLESDLNVFCLADELLLDFEPSLTEAVLQRLEKYIVADDVQVIDIGGLYGLLSVQGPEARKVVVALGLFQEFPNVNYTFSKASDPKLGELYLMNLPRLGCPGFDLFAPVDVLPMLTGKLIEAAKAIGGCIGGWTAFETVRIESGIPRFGADMDGSNFPQECGLDEKAVSYTKGCYIGQEVLNRIHTMGHVNRQLCGLTLAEGLNPLPGKGERLFQESREVGVITSAVASPALKQNIALGILRREAATVGTELELRSATGQSRTRVVALPMSNT